MIDSGVAYDKLASLDSAEEIRHFLAHQGIKGIPVSSSSCAVSRYMNQVTGIDHHGTTRTSGITNHKTGANFPSTPTISEFVANFDMRDYPELIEET